MEPSPSRAQQKFSLLLPKDIPSAELAALSIADIRRALASGAFSARELVVALRARIEALDPALHAVIELNPEAEPIAADLDAERARGGVRGPLHGVPVLLKDNIDTADSMLTTAGSLALLTSLPQSDATVAARLREAGAVLLGKTNLSEWANFRSSKSISGWSARGGQTRNPYGLAYTPCGSSSGSGVAVAAGYVPVALGTETDGSIVCPATVNGVVGLKPTVGLTSRAGVIPIAHSQDTVGPLTRTVTDAALILDALMGRDPRDPATADQPKRVKGSYQDFLVPNGLSGARIGVPRHVYCGYNTAVDDVLAEALELMRRAGAVIVDPADIPTAELIENSRVEIEVLLYEFKAGIAAYLATRVAHPDHPGAPIPRKLCDLIAFNETYAKLEMPLFGQEWFVLAEQKGPLSERAYKLALAESQALSREMGLDKVLESHNLDALVAPTGGPAALIGENGDEQLQGSSSSPAAMAGYPLLSVPAGFVDGRPVGITFMGRAYSEPTLLRLAYAYEQLHGPFTAPSF